MMDAVGDRRGYPDAKADKNEPLERGHTPVYRTSV